jgi:RNA recognition motif-containing protein
LLPVATTGPVAFNRQGHEEQTLVMRIYAGNLDYALTSDELRALFAPFGEVASAEVQVKGRTGQSRGFGLVEMPNDREAEAAITALHGREHNGRKLTINESRPRRTVRDQYASGGWFGSGGR